MKKFLLLIILFSGCQSVQTIEPLDITNKLDGVIKKINHDRNYILTLKNEHIATSGYYYIVNNDGLIIFHPNTLLIGKNFNRFWYVNLIIKNKTGCLNYFFQNTEYYIFFKPLNENEILCLSLTREELRGTLPECLKKEE